MVINLFNTLTFMMLLSPTFPFGSLPTGMEFLIFKITLSDGLLARAGSLPDGI